MEIRPEFCASVVLPVSVHCSSELKKASSFAMLIFVHSFD